MITKENISDALHLQIQTSLDLKKEMDCAVTATKKDYIKKKLVKNNLVASKLLVALERITKIQGNKNDTTDDADRNSREES